MLTELNNIISASRQNLTTALAIVALLWAIQIVNFVLRYRLNIFGILPRHPWGLLGIVGAPFLHGSFNHLFFNSIPLFILVNLLLLKGQQVFIYITIGIMLLSGLATWLFGRKAIHVGASSVIMGYWSYLLSNAVVHRQPGSIILGVLCLYYLAGLAINLLPTDIKSSWEGHVFGFLAGIALSLL